VAKTTKADVWGIYVPMPGVIPLATLRTRRASCIKNIRRFILRGRGRG
jgi:hypothetical protein